MTSFTRSLRAAAFAVCCTALFAVLPALAGADTTTSLIEQPVYSTGTIHDQGGWSSEGAAGIGEPLDHKVTSLASLGFPNEPDSAYGDAFGRLALRISNSLVSGGFENQTFSPSIPNEAGEVAAKSGGRSGGTRMSHFDASFTVASATPLVQQPGLAVAVSPDRGDGARMSYLRFEDQADGIHVIFDDYRHSVGDFVEHDVATLDRMLPHRIRLVIDFVNGPDNDVVHVYKDGVDVTPAGATTWEGYFNYEESNPTRTVDSLLFRTRDPAAPATDGLGFLFDNVAITTPSIGSVGPSGPTGATGAAGSNGSNGSNGANGAPGSSGATGATGVAGNAFTAPGVTFGTAILVNRSYVRVPISCAAPKGAYCVGTIRVITGRNKTLASGMLSVKPGAQVVKLRPRISLTRIAKKVVVRVSTYGADGKIANQSATLKVS
jgi:hypothetical protein